MLKPNEKSLIGSKQISKTWGKVSQPMKVDPQKNVLEITKKVFYMYFAVNCEPFGVKRSWGAKVIAIKQVIVAE